MDGIIPKLRWSVKQKLIRRMRRCRDPALKMRYLVIVNVASGRTATETAAALSMHRATVYRVAKRFGELGEIGLLDHREDNGQAKLDEEYLAKLYEVVRGNPAEHGWRRPTWTRELLVETMRKFTGVQIHVGTMSRALRMIRARRGRPRPVVCCPWPKGLKTRRIRMIERLLADLPPGHVAVYEDEVDIHLNPEIGSDWMVCGQQKQVVTPGKNVKRYLAGAMDAKTGKLTWVEGDRKNSVLFIALLKGLLASYPRAKVIHVVLDNYRVHSSRITQVAMDNVGGRIVLHFLPPYCPQFNKIERLWEDLHAEVTRNHRCPNIASLMRRVRGFMRKRSSHAQRSYRKNVA